MFSCFDESQIKESDQIIKLLQFFLNHTKMKKIFAISFLFVMLNFSLLVKADDRIFKPFKIVTSMAYVMPKNLVHDYAFAFHMEPKYAFTDNFWLGIRLETALMVQKPILQDDYQAIAVFSILPFLDYSLVVSEKFRPFVGLGFGTYTYRLFYDGPETDNAKFTETKMGFCPRIGFEINNFNLSFEHNFVNGGTQYSAIRAGFVMGGGLLSAY
jgi:hypothetical protein